MELEIIERLENDSKLSSGYDFVSKYKSISVPYLTFLSFLTIVGTIGNFLVLGTLLIVKVSPYGYHIYVYFSIRVSHGGSFAADLPWLGFGLNILLKYWLSGGELSSKPPGYWSNLWFVL